jgi:Kelch motif
MSTLITRVFTASVATFIASLFSLLILRPAYVRADADQLNSHVQRGQWFVGHDMQESRGYPARALLSHNRVIVIGGMDDGFNAGNSAEIYDADLDAWTLAAPVPRILGALGTAAVLPSGQVLYVGGYFSGASDLFDLSEANLSFLFDPDGTTSLPDGTLVPGKWTNTGPLPGVGIGNVNGNAIVTSGKVVIAGGISDDSTIGPDSFTASRHAYVYTIKSGTWKQIELNEPRAMVPLVKLGDHRVFVSGGRQVFDSSDGNDYYSNTAEIYDPHQSVWELTAPMPIIPDEDGCPAVGSCASLKPGSRFGHIQHVLKDGRVLVAGGVFSISGNPYQVRSSALIFDPSLGTWVRTANMPLGLVYAISSDLSDGRVLVSAGSSDGLIDNFHAWIFNPLDETWTPAAPMPCIVLDDMVAIAYGVPLGTMALPSSSYEMQTGVTRLQDGHLVFSGGFSNEVIGGVWGTFSKRTYVYNPKQPTGEISCPASNL